MNGSSIRRYWDTQSTAARDLVTRAQDEQASYYTDLQQIGATAASQVRNVYDTYIQEFQASAGGDDAILRAGTAYRNLQREYARIEAEYYRGCQERYARMADTMGSLMADAHARSMDSWIEYLRDVRQSLSSAQATASSSKSGDR